MLPINPVPSYTLDASWNTFRRALDHISPTAIYDFLYNSQDSHLPHLEQMLLQPNALFINLYVNTTTTSDAPSLNELMNCLALPTFPFGQLSARYQVCQHVHSSVSLCTSPYVARCLMDDERVVFLMFTEFDNGLTEVGIIIQHSPALQERCFLVLATTQFRAVMETLANGGAYREGMLQNALIYTFRTQQIRSCPSCGKPPVACACPLRLVQKPSPADFDTDMFNAMEYLAGGYGGVSYQALYEEGVNLRTWASGVAAKGILSFEPAESHNLQSWAMHHALQGRENLHKMVMTNVDTNAPAIEYVSERDREPHVCTDGIAEENDGLAQASFPHDFNPPLDGEHERIPLDWNAPAGTGGEFPHQGSTEHATVPQDQRIRTHTEAISILHGTRDDGATLSQDGFLHSDAVAPTSVLRSARDDGATLPQNGFLHSNVVAPTSVLRSAHDDCAALPQDGFRHSDAVAPTSVLRSARDDGATLSQDGFLHSDAVAPTSVLRSARDDGATLSQDGFLHSDVVAPTSALHGAHEVVATLQQELFYRSDVAAITSTMHGSRERYQTTELRGDSDVFSHAHIPEDEVDISTQPTGRTEQPQVPQPPRRIMASSTRSVQQPQHAHTSGQASTPLKDDAVTRPKRMGRPPTRKRGVATRVVPIAAATNAPALESVETEINKNSDEAKRRLESRKARNRESAFRSNERKKKQVEELKANLEEAKETEAALREQERQLKEANDAMREQLNS